MKTAAILICVTAIIVTVVIVQQLHRDHVETIRHLDAEHLSADARLADEKMTHDETDLAVAIDQEGVYVEDGRKLSLRDIDADRDAKVRRDIANKMSSVMDDYIESKRLHAALDRSRGQDARDPSQDDLNAFRQSLFVKYPALAKVVTP